MKQTLFPRGLLGFLGVVLLTFTLPAYLDPANNPGLAKMTGEAATLGSTAGAFLARQLTLALIALYGALQGTRQPVLIGAFGVAFFNIHDAAFLWILGSGGPGAVGGLVLGAIAFVVIVLVLRRPEGS